MLAIGAMSYGLNPKEPTKGDALDFLEQLCQNGGFELDGSDAPILICLDYEAAAWNRSGGTYEIIVPVEGTLSYRMGLFSDVPWPWNRGWMLPCCRRACRWPVESGHRTSPGIIGGPAPWGRRTMTGF